MQTSMSLRLSEDLANKINMIAKVTGRTKSFIAVRALEEFVENQEWQIAEIKKGLAEANAGDFAGEDEIQAMDAKWGRGCAR